MVAFVLAALANHTFAAEQPTRAWPPKVVVLEQLQALTPLNMKVQRLVEKGAVRGPSILRVHIGVTGDVVKLVLLESCGNGELDEAAMRAMNDMKFRPHIEGGAPTEVSLVVPIHVPKRLGRSNDPR